MENDALIEQILLDDNKHEVTIEQYNDIINFLYKKGKNLSDYGNKSEYFAFEGLDPQGMPRYSLLSCDKLGKDAEISVYYDERGREYFASCVKNLTGKELAERLQEDISNRKGEITTSPERAWQPKVTLICATEGDSTSYVDAKHDHFMRMILLCLPSKTENKDAKTQNDMSNSTEMADVKMPEKTLPPNETGSNAINSSFGLTFVFLLAILVVGCIFIWKKKQEWILAIREIISNLLRNRKEK